MELPDCNKRDIYSAYGLSIQSKIPLDTPALSSEEADVTISFGKTSASKKVRNSDGIYYNHISAEKVVLGWDTAGFYHVENGTRIIIDPHAASDQDDLRQPLLGICMSLILQQRGRCVLHGSAVDIQGGAWIFLGGKGEGEINVSCGADS